MGAIADYKMCAPIWEFWTQHFERIGDDRDYSHATLRMKIQRKFAIYWWRIGMFTMILSFSALSVFQLDKSDHIEDRYAILLTLLLAATAFQYIINLELPKLPYLTLMDEYVLFSFGFVFFVIACIFGAGFDAVPESVDSGLCALCSGIFVLFHIYFVIKAYKARKYENKKIKMNRWDYLDEGYEKKEDNDKALELRNNDIKMDKASRNFILDAKSKSPWMEKDLAALPKVQ